MIEGVSFFDSLSSYRHLKTFLVFNKKAGSRLTLPLFYMWIGSLSDL